MNLLVKIFCILFSLVSCSGNQSIKYLTDLEQANIKGHVIKLITETYKIDSLGDIGKLETRVIEIFNHLGYTVTDTAKDFIENNEVVNFLKYNQNGSLSALSTFENGKKQSKMLLKYDGDQCKVIQLYDSNDKLESYYDNILQNKYGLLLKLNSYDASGRFITSFTNEYDSIYQIRATAKDSSGTPTSDVKIALNNKKYQENMLEISYVKGAVAQKYFSYKYQVSDRAGNWVQQSVFDDNGKAIKIVRRFFTYE
jgi:hypothetical protein